MLHMLLLLLLLFWAVVVVVVVGAISGPHITDVNILLPPKMTHPVEYRLQGSDGCFKWTWDHHDVLAVLPEFNVSNQCSTSARLKSIAPYSGRKETAVYATDVHTGTVIRCKVYIDTFSRIQIFHSSIKLDLAGLATLRVRAFDTEENVFSSLVGIQFMWNLMPETDGLPQHLTHIPLKDSPLSDCGGLCGDLDIQIKLENSGAFSDLYVVKGTEIGREIVSVHLAEPSSDYMADKIVLTVAEAMSLEPPSPVCVLTGAVVHYSLKVIRGNIPQPVTLPSAFHRWSVLNSSVAQVDRMVGAAKALNLGITTIIVEDTRVVGHTQVSSFHVVLPDSLSLHILPLSLSGDHIDEIEPIPSVARWYIVSGREYLIQVRIFSGGTWVQEVYITENDDVTLQDDQSELWSLLPTSSRIVEKGMSKVLKALSYGLGKLTATLAYSAGHGETKNILKVVQEVMVCDQVKFRMEGVSDSISLPCAPGVYQELELKVNGGCAMVSGDYKWFSSDMAIVSVSASGTVQSKRPGKVTIKAVSVFDPLNYDEIVVEVSLPNSMIALPNFPVETPVGSYLQAAVTLKTVDGDLFYKCDAFRPSIKWKTGNDAFIVVDSGETLIAEKQEILPIGTEKYEYGPACAWTNVYAANSGHTMLHATLSKEFQQYDHSTGGSFVLQAISRIAAFLPLIVHPTSDGNQFGGYWFNLVQAEADNHLENMEHLYLAPGTSFDVMLRGGPNRWDQGTEFIESVETVDDHNVRVQSGALVNQEYTSSGSTYRIICQDVGIFKLLFKRGNLIGEGHPVPAISEVLLSLSCTFPSSIAVIADETVNSLEVIQSAAQADRGSGRIRTTPITIANGRAVRLSAVGISEAGKAFGNSSSLFLKWELKDCDALAFWDDIQNLAMLSTWEKYLVLANATGLCVVRATVTGPIDFVSDRHSLKHFTGSENDLTDAIRLQLVSSLRVYPGFSLLYLNHDAKFNLSITGGSCLIDAAVNDTQVVEIKQHGGVQCVQLLLAPKNVGTALVTVRDVGLAPPLSAFSVVQVADVDWIKIKSGEELSIVEGSSLSISFLAGINDGSTFESSQYAYMNIHVHIEDRIIELVDEEDLSCCEGGYVDVPNFRIRAILLGITTLYVSARQHTGHEILSQPIKVEVFAPPSIHPSDVFLVPGASYMLTVRGGPKTAYIEFVSMNGEVAKIHKATGRVSAQSPGNTTIVAKIHRNGDIFICQAYGEVKVGVPSSAMLNVQSDQLAVGRQVPIFPSLSEGNLFSFYELCGNYKWTIHDEEVLSFQAEDDFHGGKPAMHLSSEKGNGLEGYASDKHLGFIQLLHGRFAGRTDVTVSFSCDFIAYKSFSQSRLYTASISLSVVSELPLALGSPITWILPPHYTTSDLLPSASKTLSKGGSSPGTVTYSILRDCRRKVALEEDDPIHIDGGRIRTKESGDLACIQAKDRSNGRVEVASCVKVAEVTQIRFMAEKMLVNTLGIGAKIDVPVEYYDVLGNPFLEARDVLPLVVETNHRDVISVENAVDGSGNVHLKAISHGLALVQVGFSNDPKKSDYVVIIVGAHLHPQNPTLHLGCELNFSIEGLSDLGSGQWFSSNASILSVDKLSGRAKAIGKGSARVVFESSDMKLQTTVAVLQREIISVEAPREVLTNVPLPTNGYSFLVKLNDAHGHNFKSAKARTMFLFDCRVDPFYVGYVKPWVDLDTDTSYCLFFPFSPEHLVLTASKSGAAIQDLAVTVKASLIGEQNISGSASALFVGGFIILGTEGDSMQLNLTPESNRSVLTVVGNTNVNIYWHDQEQLSIRPLHGEDSQGGSRTQYEVKIRRREKFKDKVTFTLPATGQRMEVNVSYEPVERREPSVHIWAGVAVCSILTILAVSLLIYYLDKPVRPRPSAPPGTPCVAAPTTPERSSPAVVNEHSPRTPQPFLDYVRRTIHETPYYRQDFRRRVNPQNTF